MDLELTFQDVKRLVLPVVWRWPGCGGTSLNEGEGPVGVLAAGLGRVVAADDPDRLVLPRLQDAAVTGVLPLMGCPVLNQDFPNEIPPTRWSASSG